ncbi:hypothetical protein AB0I60_09050 [Actinosynnema sp. NPDC050436]|uniref:hypothetical protein n=1 Tax=Actinosynnema sp. NPDC050436 TaxID=3155659 RepID=UPI0033DC1381
MTDPDPRPQPAESSQATGSPAVDDVATAPRTEPDAAPAPGPATDAAPAPDSAPEIGTEPATDVAPGSGPHPEARPEAVAEARPEPVGGPHEAAGDAPRPAPPVDPQLLFGGLSLASIEADIDAMMSDKMTELDGMLAGLEELVVRLEGEITSLEAPPDDSPTP